MYVPSFLAPLVPLDMTRPPAVPGAPVLGAVIGGAAPPVVLNFAMQQQAYCNWCWAATAASVSAYYNQNVMSQCQIASSVLNLSCCGDSMDYGCNSESDLAQALTLVAHLAQPAAVAPLAFELLQAQLNLSRPVCCHFKWIETSGVYEHFNAIYGCDPGVGDVDVADPAYSNPTVPFSSLANNYEASGAWDVYYLTE